MSDLFTRWNLRPFERRLVVGTAVVLFLVINVVWVWPHFSDWSTMKKRLGDAVWKQEIFQREIDKLPTYKREIATFEKSGAPVPPDDQAVQLMRTVVQQAGQFHVDINSANSRALSVTNLFFIEQSQNITVVSKDEDLVKFLYSLGSDASFIRVRDLTLRPDAPRYRLVATIQLVASYQKNQKAAAPAVNTKTTNAPASTPQRK